MHLRSSGWQQGLTHQFPLAHLICRSKHDLESLREMLVPFLRYIHNHQVFAILSFKDLQDASTKSKLLYHGIVSFPVLRVVTQQPE